MFGSRPQPQVSDIPPECWSQNLYFRPATKYTVMCGSSDFSVHCNTTDYLDMLVKKHVTRHAATPTMLAIQVWVR